MDALTFSRSGLILSSDRHRTGLGDDALERAARRGDLVRLRRGAYCDTSRWDQLDARQRYLLGIRAVVAGASRPPVLCSWSAAAAWGMPILDDWPDTVHVLSEPAAGGRSKNGVRRHPFSGLGGREPLGNELAGARERESWRRAGIVERDGLLVTGIAHTTLDLMLDSRFGPAVAALDWSLWRKNAFRVGIDDVREALDRRAPRYGRRHAEAVLDSGTHLSDSYGESMARAVMVELGYPRPELQVRFVDEQGEMFVDYFWREQNIAGEFDGAAKYLRPDYRRGLTPSEVVWREKKREDRLRRQVSATVRIIWGEVREPLRLDRMLREVGMRPASGGSALP